MKGFVSKKSSAFKDRKSHHVFQEPKLANAILDRILHHATVVTIMGDSYRLKDHLTKESE